MRPPVQSSENFDHQTVMQCRTGVNHGTDAATPSLLLVVVLFLRVRSEAVSSAAQMPSFGELTAFPPCCCPPPSGVVWPSARWPAFGNGSK